WALRAKSSGHHDVLDPWTGAELPVLRRPRKVGHRHRLSHQPVGGLRSERHTARILDGRSAMPVALPADADAGWRELTALGKDVMKPIKYVARIAAVFVALGLLTA